MAPKTTKGGKPKTKSKKNKGGGKSESELQEEKERLELIEKLALLEAEKNRDVALTEELENQTSHLKDDWEISKKEKREKERILLEKQQRLQKIKDEHALKLSEIKRQIKELLFSNQDELSETTTQSLVEYQILVNQQEEEIEQLMEERRELSDKIREVSLRHLELKKSLEAKFREDVAELREEMSCRTAKTAAYWDRRNKILREEEEERLNNEVRELEKKNEIEINEIKEKNREELHRIRETNNDKINKNLDIITAMKKELQELTMRDRHDRKALNELRTKNNEIMIPLKSKKEGLQQLEVDITTAKTQKQDLDALKRELASAQKELEKIEWDHEVLFQQLEELKKDRDEWKKKYRDSIYSRQQKTNFENLILERKLSKMSMDGETATAMIADILRKANIGLNELDPSSKVAITDVIEEKEEEEKALLEELNLLKDARKKLRDKYESIMEEYNHTKTKLKTARKSALLMA